MTQTRRSFLRQDPDGSVVINGISCAHMRTVAVQFCGDLLEESSFAADRDGADELPTPRSFLVALIAHIAAKQKSKPNYLAIVNSMNDAQKCTHRFGMRNLHATRNVLRESLACLPNAPDAEKGSRRSNWSEISGFILA